MSQLADVLLDTRLLRHLGQTPGPGSTTWHYSYQAFRLDEYESRLLDPERWFRRVDGLESQHARSGSNVVMKNMVVLISSTLIQRTLRP